MQYLGVVILPSVAGLAAPIQPVQEIAALVMLNTLLRGELDVDVLVALGNRVGLLDVDEHGFPFSPVDPHRGLPRQQASQELQRRRGAEQILPVLLPPGLEVTGRIACAVGLVSVHPLRAQRCLERLRERLGPLDDLNFFPFT